EHRVTVSFVDSPWERENVQQPHQTDFGRGSDEQYDGYAAVDTLLIRGPFQPEGAENTESRRAIFVCYPKTAADEDTCARKIIWNLARRAYRRPVTNEDLQTLLTFFKSGHQQGGFEGGIQAALERLLISFNFLFRIEGDPPSSATNGMFRISDVDLASRLSFFLWSSIPDSELLDLAVRGKLKDRRVHGQRVRRM